ncbi:hypothetical protein [Litoreibacter meonggei]|nr:hypothetical protein [Litoreibacter meonggei]
MKKADRFRRPPLKGLFKLHFQPTGGRSIGALVTNVLNETGHPMREKRMAALLEKYEEQVVDHRILHEVISEMLDGGLDDRSKRGRLTGDWVIFEKAGKTRRYLTIATHEERNDDQVYHRVIAARQEMDA